VSDRPVPEGGAPADGGAARAAEPVLLAVDDDPRVLRAVARDLRSHYAGRFRVVRADSGESALEALRELKVRGTPVALVLSDQRMPGMGGIELLGHGRELFPDAKVVLLTAYADTDVAIEAINRVRLDYYILKPWDPPEEQLYPVLDDLLEDWQASVPPSFDGVRVVGHRFSPEAFALRDFLARNQVPYRWIDVEQDADAGKVLAATEGERLRLPVVVAGDERLSAPTVAEVARLVGIGSTTETRSWELLIVGAGPAGLAAAVYGASEGLSTGLVEREAPGGQAGQSSRIENYLGFPSGLSGSDLARRALTQATRFGAERVAPAEVTGLEVREPYRLLQLADGGELSCSALVVASGVTYRRLGAPGVEALAGRGVFYGSARTEAPECEGQDVVVVGGANSAGQAAVYFSGYARRVFLVVRAASLDVGMSSYLVDQLGGLGNVVVRTRSEVAEAIGDGHLEAVVLRDLDSGGTEELGAASMFVFIGAEPHTDWLSGTVARDERGFVLTGADVGGRIRTPAGVERDRYLLESSVPGVFAVGDVRARSVKRVASAVGEGSIAVQFIHEYLAL
jgi:thioredoxin reductase (NADPH)